MQLILFFLLILLLLITVAVFLFFISINISNIYGAPYIPIRKKIIRDLLAFGEVSEDDNFYDLGCGDGRVLIEAALNFKVKKAVGYEASFWPYFTAKFLVKKLALKDSVKIYRKNFFKADISDATFIYIYLFPKLVDRLASKIAKEAARGVKVLSPTFPIDLKSHPEFCLLKQSKVENTNVFFYEKI